MNWIVKCNACLCCCCRKGFQNLEKIKDANRQSRQLDELTGKMRECKRYSEIEPPLSFRMHVISVHLTVQHWLNTLSNSILNEYTTVCGWEKNTYLSAKHLLYGWPIVKSIFYFLCLLCNIHALFLGKRKRCFTQGCYYISCTICFPGFCEN
jgi:hypothetical protein